MKLMAHSIGMISTLAFISFSTAQGSIAANTNQTSISDTDQINSFTVKGIKLGMTIDEARAVCGMTLDEKHSGKSPYMKCYSQSQGFSIEKLNVAVSLPPYGNGVSFVSYSKQLNKNFDRKVFANQFSADLSAKYGKPQYEHLGTPVDVNPDYFVYGYQAFWGPTNKESGAMSALSSYRPDASYDDLIREVIEKRDDQTSIMKIVPCGKYLTAQVDKALTIRLFDTAPAFAVKRFIEEKSIKAAKETKVDF